MKRKPNILDLDLYRRDRFHNPLFDLITDDFDNAFLEKNLDDEYILDHFYVDDRSDESVTNERLLSLFTSKPHLICRSKDLFSKIDSDPGMVYLLLGKKGIGKTLLLKYFFNQIKYHGKYLPIERTLLSYLDLKSKKSDSHFLNSLPTTLVEELFFYIKREDLSLSSYLSIPSKIREIDNSYMYIEDDSSLVQRVLDNKQEALEFLFTWATKQQIDLFLIFDNVDDFPGKAIKAIIDKCIELKDKFNAKCVVALRDYWNPHALSITDINICACHLGKPDIYNIVKNRLNCIPVKNISKVITFDYGGKNVTLDAKDVISSFDAIVRDLTQSKKELHDQLYQLSNYNTRDHLRNIYHFFHSPYLFTRPNFIRSLIDKIKNVDSNFVIEKPRKIRFFDFLESFMAIHTLCYDFKASCIFNLFHHEWLYGNGYNYMNVLIYIRVLQDLPLTKASVKKDQVIAHLSAIGYQEPSIRDALDKLLEEALIESADGSREVDVENISISTKGLVYINKLIYEYSYLLFISDAVPMPDEYKIDIVDKFGNEDIPLERGSLTLKHESVLKFAEFLAREEETEKKICHPDYRFLLDRIIDGDKTSNIMRDKVEYTMSKMMTYGQRKAKKIQRIQITES